MTVALVEPGELGARMPRYVNQVKRHAVTNGRPNLARMWTFEQFKRSSWGREGRRAAREARNLQAPGQRSPDR